jgi:chemotaxis protein methyltransferase CheR
MSDFALKTSVSNEFISLVEKVASLVHKISGNKLGDKQFFMIETRLRKRMLELGLKDPNEYVKYIDQNLQKESAVLVSLITTHHTFFFREFTHFELLKKMLPSLVSEAKARGDKLIRVWSAACSRGQEAYSIGMFLEYYLPQIDPSMDYTIFGSDIDEESVKIAANGVYHQNEIKEVPMNFLGNHWAKGTGDILMYAKMKDTIRKKCQFKPGNLLNPEAVVGHQKFDVIFCRNVFIYFEQHQIEKICSDLLKHMYPNALFFSGISESLTGFKIEFSSVGPSAYMHKASVEKKVTEVSKAKPQEESKSVRSVPMPSPVQMAPEILKVMCIDDSPSILTLLKKILSKENGFEVIVTANNGLDAMEKMKTHKVDLVTLDIHMPEMDGVTYLMKNFNKNHPPVVMISSASREDSDSAMKALKFGASDYVEKPSLQNLEEKGEEIRTKLKTVFSDRLMGMKISTLDIENTKKISIDDPSNKVRVLTASISDLKKIKQFQSGSHGICPPTVVFFEGQSEILEALVKENSREYSQKLFVLADENMPLQPGEIYFADMKKYFKPMSKKYERYKTSIMCFGIVSKFCSESVIDWKNAQLLLEDLGVGENKKNLLKDVATDVVPMTSFAYMSNVFLAKK